MRNGIIDLHSFNGTEQLAMAGAFSSLTSTSVWLLVVTFLGLPVSATHSIVGSTLGYAIVEHGIDGIHFFKLGLIGKRKQINHFNIKCCGQIRPPPGELNLTKTVNNFYQV